MITDKFCFVHLERTGGQSIRSWVGEHEKKGNIVVHKDIGESTARILPANRPFTFGFIRSPYDWYLSRYLFYCKRKEAGEKKPSGQFAWGIDKLIMNSPELPSFEKWFLHNVRRDKTRIPYTPYFTGNTRAIPYFNMANTVKDVFFNERCELLLDYLGNTANLARDIKEISEMLKLPLIDAPHANRTEHDKAVSYYTEEMKDYVEDNDKFVFKLIKND